MNDTEKKDQKVTDCGYTFKHLWHSYRTERGKVKICDGEFREDKS